MNKKIFILSLGLILSTVSFAKKTPEHQTLLIHQNAPVSVKIGNKMIDSRTALPTSIFNINYKVDAETIEAKAQQFLDENPLIIHAKKNDFSNLKFVFTSAGKSSTSVRFKQFVNNIPVYKSDLVVSINNKNLVTNVSASYKIVNKSVSSKTSLTNFLAQDIATNYLSFNSSLKQLSSELVVFAEDGIVRLAYKTFIISNDYPGEWEVLVDANNGVILRAFDTLHYAQVAGNVSAFDPDPLTTAGVNYGASGYVDGSDVNTSQLESQIYSFNASVMDNGSGVFKLENQWAVIVDHESPTKGLFTQNTNNFNFNREDDGFEASNVFYHLQTYMEYLNITLGVSVGPINHSGGVQFDPHGLGGTDNSHYSSGSNRLAFGEGGVDDSEDADVIIHELGHGLHDWVTGGNLSQVNGLSEGTGDYFANSYARTRPNFQWTSNDDQYYWVFSWDGHNEFWNGRRTNYSAVYPGGLTGSIHTDGQIWSSCLMKIWDEIGAAKTDTIVLEGLRMTGNSTNQAQAAQAVLQAAFDLRYNFSDITTIENQFNQCGYNVASVFVDPIFINSFETL
jgi:Zn-dependent metalloprotease